MLTKKKAKDCKKNHKLLEKACIACEYKSIDSTPSGELTKIKVKFPGTNKYIEYKR